MNLVDLTLITLLLLAAAVGWRLGLVRMSVVVIGLSAGGLAMLWAAPKVLDAVSAPPILRAVALPVTLFVVAVGVLFLMLDRAREMHGTLDESALRLPNRMLGSLATVISALVVIWGLATALVLMPTVMFSSQMQRSVILAGMDQAVGSDAGGLLARIYGLVEAHDMPRVFTGLGLRPMPEVDPASPSDITDAARDAAYESVVRVFGQTTCGPGVAGTGWVIDDALVMTNAHVVDGMPSPRVSTSAEWLGTEARIVHFDPARDIALLEVPELGRQPLQRGGTPASGDPLTIAGYPGGSELTVRAARLRGVTKARGEDIYGRDEVVRRILVLAGEVLPGNSGGPVLDERGRVVGLVFAATVESDAGLGYALTLEEFTDLPDRRQPASASLAEHTCD